MRAEIISIGTELLLGEIVDTNTPFLADQLASLGIDLYFLSSIGDNHERLLTALRQAWRRSELIITTGGLGPTQDDITREGIAVLLDEKLKVDPSLKGELIKFFEQRNLEMPQSNLKQATLTPSSVAISNPKGTAPGWWVERDGRLLIAMPGPPTEMQYMWQNEILPKLKNKTRGIILSRVIKTFSVSEAKIDELLTPFLSCSNPTLAIYAKRDGIHLRITAKAAQTKEAERMISKREAEVRAILGDSIWGVDDDTQGSIAGRLLNAKGLSLAVAESFTGGLLINILANIPGNQRFFKGGLVATSEKVKLTLGLDPYLIGSTVSTELATAMASMVRHKLDASIGISLEGSTKSTRNRRYGELVVAINSDQINLNKVQRYTGTSYTKNRAAYIALFDLIKLIKSV